MARAVSVYCIWRDSESYIQRALKQFEDLESLRDFEFKFYFYENDSKDNTAKILEKWIKGRGEFLSESLNAPKFGSVTDPARMKLLCECRNKSKKLRYNNLLDGGENEIALVVDSDVIFNNENFLAQVNLLDKTPKNVMITPNVRQQIPDYVFGETHDSYYDVYPFRDKCCNSGMYFSDCPSFRKHDQHMWKLGQPIRVISAFGGFAIIRANIFNLVRWSSDLHCDHVNMVCSISRYGNVLIDPLNKVYVDVGIDKINVDVCKTVGANQRKTYEQYFS